MNRNLITCAILFGAMILPAVASNAANSVGTGALHVGAIKAPAVAPPAAPLAAPVATQTRPNTVASRPILTPNPTTNVGGIQGGNGLTGTGTL